MPTSVIGTAHPLNMPRTTGRGRIPKRRLKSVQPTNFRFSLDKAVRTGAKKETSRGVASDRTPFTHITSVPGSDTIKKKGNSGMSMKRINSPRLRFPMGKL